MGFHNACNVAALNSAFTFAKKYSEIYSDFRLKSRKVLSNFQKVMMKTTPLFQELFLTKLIVFPIQVKPLISQLYISEVVALPIADCYAKKEFLFGASQQFLWVLPKIPRKFLSSSHALENFPPFIKVCTNI